MDARIAALGAALWIATPGVAGCEASTVAPGPALRAALAERDAMASAERLAALALAAPEIADHASELRIDALLRAAEAETALAEAGSFRTRFPTSWLRERVAEHEGSAHVALGQEAEARAAFSDALSRGPEGGAAGRALLLAQIAASHERSGEASAAAERWREIWTRYAATPEARAAELSLARLAAQDPTLVYRTSEAWRERCFGLSEALYNEAALESCAAALAAAPGDPRLLRERADLLFRMRRYSDAVEAFAALGDDPSASFWQARSLARAGRVESSLAVFARLAGGPDRELAARSRFLAGTLLEDTDLAAAEQSYRRVAEHAPTAAQRTAARWRLAWLAFRRGDFAAAAHGLEVVADDAPDSGERVRGRYWLGRALERLGKSEGREQLGRIASDEPLSYYGWRAASLLPAETPAGVASAPRAGAAEGPGLPQLALRRIGILLEAGLDERAAAEIRELGPVAKRRAARLVLAQLLVEAGRFDLAQRLVLAEDAEALAQRPAPGEEALWWLAWPTAYAASVERSARKHGVDPALVYAIMREESGYQVDALSTVGARGLTQIMPDTGRRLAADLGARAFDPAELFVPDRNLELGAFYLSQLVARFDGRFSAAIASYNAGPEAVARWLAADGARADDEWVESIPYDQTRGYVKRVLRSMHVYRTLYGS